MLLTDEYRELNRQMHAEKPHYGISGQRYADYVTKIANLVQAKSILDYGCGKGTLAPLMDRPVAEYDPCISGKDVPPCPADLVVCTDVLEHIEPQCLDAVLDDLKRLVLKRGVFVIATRPALKHLPDGRNAHLIQEHMRWWLPKILSRFELEVLRDSEGEFIVVVAPHE